MRLAISTTETLSDLTTGLFVANNNSIGMTMDDFQIDGIRQAVTESLKSAVRYSIPLDPI